MTDELWAPAPARAVPSIDLGLPGLTDVREVARGGDSVVYRARQAALHRDVAIKVLLETDPATVAGFARELEITVRLGRQHPHIVTVLDTATTAQGHPCLVMDFYDLGSLHDRLRSHGPLPVAEVVAAGTAVADALRFAHRHGVLHRDVKPQNVLVLPTSYVLTDFGIARMADAGHTASLERFSYRHASVQVLDGLEPTPSDDVWSLGSTLFTLLDGRAPFAAPDPADDTALSYLRRARTGQRRPLVRADVPVALRTLVEACLAPDREHRPPSADAVHAALLALPTETRTWSPEPTSTATPVRGTRYLGPDGRSAPRTPAGPSAPARTAPLAPPPVPATLPPLPTPAAAPVVTGPPAATGHVTAGHRATADAAFAPPAAPTATPRTSAPPLVTGPPTHAPAPAGRAALPPIELPPLQPQDDLALAPSALSLLSGPSTTPVAPDDEDTGMRPDPRPAAPPPSRPADRREDRSTAPPRRGWVPVVAFMGGAIVVGSAVGMTVTSFASRDRAPSVPAAQVPAGTDQGTPTGASPWDREITVADIEYDASLSPRDVTFEDHETSIDLFWTNASPDVTATYVVDEETGDVVATAPSAQATSVTVRDIDPDRRPICLRIVAINATDDYRGGASQNACQREPQ